MHEREFPSLLGTNHNFRFRVAFLLLNISELYEAYFKFGVYRARWCEIDLVSIEEGGAGCSGCG